MAAMDPTAVVFAIAENASAVSAVSMAVLFLAVAIWSYGVIRRELIGEADPLAVSVGFEASAVAVPASTPVQSVDAAEYERLGSVWQGWQDQIQRARDAGGVAPAASQNIRFYDALVARGMDAADAIAAVEARNAAVSRSELAAEAADQRRSDALADAYDAAEHAAAVERYQSQPVDLTVRLGGGWK